MVVVMPMVVVTVMMCTRATDTVMRRWRRPRAPSDSTRGRRLCGAAPIDAPASDRGARSFGHGKPIHDGPALSKGGEAERLWLHAPRISALGVLRAAKYLDTKRLMAPTPRAAQRVGQQILRTTDPTTRLARAAFVEE